MTISRLNTSSLGQQSSTFLTANDVNGTTGSPTVTTPTIGGIAYRVYSFAASGSITFGKEGLIDLLVVGGGGGPDGGNTGGGAGAVRFGTFTAPSGSVTVTVGSGAGRSQVNGNTSSFGSVLYSGGGAYAGSVNEIGGGGSGGGAAGGIGGGAGTGTYGGYVYGITGSSVEYGCFGNNYSTSAVTPGTGGSTSLTAAQNGIVIVRVRANV